MKRTQNNARSGIGRRAGCALHSHIPARLIPLLNLESSCLLLLITSLGAVSRCGPSHNTQATPTRSSLEIEIQPLPLEKGRGKIVSV